MHVDARRGAEGTAVQLFNGGLCAALCACKPPAASMAKKLFADLAAKKFVKATAQLLAAGRIGGKLHLHLRELRHGAAGPYATLGAIVRLKPSGASFVVEEIWSLDDDAITSIPTAIRQTGALLPVK